MPENQSRNLNLEMMAMLKKVRVVRNLTEAPFRLDIFTSSLNPKPGTLASWEVIRATVADQIASLHHQPSVASPRV